MARGGYSSTPTSSRPSCLGYTASSVRASFGAPSRARARCQGAGAYGGICRFRDDVVNPTISYLPRGRRCTPGASSAVKASQPYPPPSLGHATPLLTVLLRGVCVLSSGSSAPPRLCDGLLRTATGRSCGGCRARCVAAAVFLILSLLRSGFFSVSLSLSLTPLSPSPSFPLTLTHTADARTGGGSGA